MNEIQYRAELMKMLTRPRPHMKLDSPAKWVRAGLIVDKIVERTQPDPKSPETL